MNFDGIGKFDLNNQWVGKYLADPIGTDVSIVQFNCWAGGLDISGA